MKTKLEMHEIVRKRLTGSEAIRYDDIRAVEGARLVTTCGRRLAVPPEVAREIARVVSMPDFTGGLEEVAERIETRLAGPHGPLLMAQALIHASEHLRATDLHLEPGPKGASVRLRLAGQLEPLCQIPPAALDPIVAALKGLAGVLPYRRDIVQEGRIGRGGVVADVRASFVPTALGERVALRLFGQLLDLSRLGLEGDVESALHRLLDSDRGLIVVAGSTGAGKTTTLYAMLAHISASRRGAHLSLEDPVEQRLRNAGIPVDQVELAPERGISGEAMLAAALRQDVDVLSLGEVRTEAESRLAVGAAHTGRLVLAGVHAGSCEEALARLLDLGAPPARLRSTLLGIVHQSLRPVDWECRSLPECRTCGGIGRVQKLRAVLTEGPGPWVVAGDSGPAAAMAGGNA